MPQSKLANSVPRMVGNRESDLAPAHCSVWLDEPVPEGPMLML